MGWLKQRNNPDRLVDERSLCAVVFNTPGGRHLWKELMPRVPDKGELVYERDTKYKVSGVATFSGKPAAVYGGYEVRNTSYVVFLEVL
jgi:hypothetical protein